MDIATARQRLEELVREYNRGLITQLEYEGELFALIYQTLYPEQFFTVPIVPPTQA